jgi:hypothetical protein
MAKLRIATMAAIAALAIAAALVALDLETHLRRRIRCRVPASRGLVRSG